MTIRRRIHASGILALSLILAGCSSAPGEQPMKLNAEPNKQANEKVLESTGVPTTEKSTVLKTVPVDGSKSSTEKFKHPLPKSDGFFPLGVWFATAVEPADIQRDKEMGLNTYVELTAGSDVDAVRSAGMIAFTSSTVPEASGFVLPDEVDMWGRGGNANWTGNSPGEGNICDPAEQACGFTILEELGKKKSPGQIDYVNFGKGVTFWEPTETAAQFVSDFGDIVSADNYWFTDTNICRASEGGTLLPEQRDLSTEECRKASNYGWTIDRVRNLVRPQGSKPVWAFVEVGHPAGEEQSPTIKPEQIEAAVWSSIIHGARGVVYFNHSFGGSCASHNVLRDCGDEPRATVTALNERISELAPVLNAPTVESGVSVTGNVDALVKLKDKKLYILLTATSSGSQEFEVHVPCIDKGAAAKNFAKEPVQISGGKFAQVLTSHDKLAVFSIDASTCKTTSG